MIMGSTFKWNECNFFAHEFRKLVNFNINYNYINIIIWDLYFEERGLILVQLWYTVVHNTIEVKLNTPFEGWMKAKLNRKQFLPLPVLGKLLTRKFDALLTDAVVIGDRVVGIEEA